MVMLVGMVDTCAGLRVSVWPQGLMSALAAAVIWLARNSRLTDAEAWTVETWGPGALQPCKLQCGCWGLAIKVIIGGLDLPVIGCPASHSLHSHSRFIAGARMVDGLNNGGC